MVFKAVTRGVQEAQVQMQKPARERLCQNCVFCLEGTVENSPPIHRWGKVQRGPSPVGTTEMTMFIGFQPSLRDFAKRTIRSHR